MEWTIQDLGAAGELVGAVAVVATLFYLALQVRHSQRATEANTRAMENAEKYAMAQAYQARADTLINIRQHQATEVLAKLAKDDFDPRAPRVPGDHPFDVGKIPSLTIAERIELRTYFESLMVHADNVTYQQSLGLMPDGRVDPDNTMLHFALPFWRALAIPLRPLIAEAVEELGIEA